MVLHRFRTLHMLLQPVSHLSALTAATALYAQAALHVRAASHTFWASCRAPEGVVWVTGGSLLFSHLVRGATGVCEAAHL